MTAKKSRVNVKCPKCENVFLPSLEEKQSRAGASARRKGHSFERKIAKDLEKWWPEGHQFKRTPMSGGSALKEGWGLAGDICTTDSKFIWHLELKNAPSQFSGLHNLFSAKANVWKWLLQAKRDCPIDKLPIIIVNRYDMSTFCIADSLSIIDRLEAANIKYLTFNSPIYPVNRAVIWLYKDMLNSSPYCWGFYDEGVGND